MISASKSRKERHEVKDSLSILRMLASKNGIIQSKDAAEHGITRAVLHLHAKQGNIERVGHGLYMFSDGILDDLLALSLVSDSIVFSHETALFLNGLSSYCKGLLV